MKVIVCTKYGPPDVLELKEVEKPAPKDNEVLVKIYAAPVNAMDVRIRGLNVPMRGIIGRIARITIRLKFGLTKPRKPILGGYLAGEIETAGKDVKRFQKGDQVYARTGWRRHRQNLRHEHPSCSNYWAQFVYFSPAVGTRTFYEEELKRQIKNHIEVLAGTTY
jgi:NADPH:quinone reductase-like Zn-dependent oxidoreductase